jgi:hypothetical protein
MQTGKKYKCTAKILARNRTGLNKNWFSISFEKDFV